MAVYVRLHFSLIPYEEYRLKKDSYLKREAYGHFLGISRYVWGGIPKAYLSNPENEGSVKSKTPVLELKANTGFSNRAYWGSDKPWIFSDSVSVKVDGQKVPASFNKATGIISVQVREPLSTGEHSVMGGFRNYNGNYSHPLEQRFIVDPPVSKIIISSSPEAVVMSSTAEVIIEVSDEDGLPVLDGTMVYLGSSSGTFENFALETKGGKAYTNLFIPDKLGELSISAVSEGKYGFVSIKTLNKGEN